MVVRLETTMPDGSTLEGNGLLFFANRNVDVRIGSLAHTEAPASGTPAMPTPVIATFWHVVGIDGNSPSPIKNCKFITSGQNSAEYDVTAVLATSPMSEIDREIAASLSKQNINDGVCLLAPGIGFSPTPADLPTRLAIPPLQPPPVVCTDVSICLVRNNGGRTNHSFLTASGRPQKRLLNDTYSFPGPTGLTGRGTSGGAVVPDDEKLTNPPELVFGFHCGHEHYPQPPDDYVFIGASTFGKLLLRAGLYHPIVDYGAEPIAESPQPNAIVSGVSNGLKWLLNKLAPT